MRSLSKLLDDPLFDLLEASAEQVCQSVRLLSDAPEFAQGKLQSLSATRQKNRQIGAEIEFKLAHTAMHSLKKEDLVAVSNALLRISTIAERLAQRLALARENEVDFDLGRLCEILPGIAEALAGMVRQLRPFDNEVNTWNFHEQLQERAERAEALAEQMISALFENEHDALRLLIRKDLIEHLTKIAGLCCGCGDLVKEIVLKYG